MVLIVIVHDTYLNVNIDEAWNNSLNVLSIYQVMISSK